MLETDSMFEHTDKKKKDSHVRALLACALFFFNYVKTTTTQLESSPGLI
jgi:hypothetical protein